MSQLVVGRFGVRTLSLVLGAGALIGGLGGCFITNTAHCGYHENGADNPCPEGFVCNVCAADNNGCVALDQMGTIEKSCIESGPTTSTTTETSTTAPTTETTVSPTVSTLDTTTTTTVDTTSTTEPIDTTTETSTTEAPSTTLMTPCDPNTPEDPACLDMDQYCVADGQCGHCQSLTIKTCTDVDPLTPACDEVSGDCVECTEDDKQLCTGNKPVCDPGSHTCGPCTQHDQCPATACDIETGECFPEDSILYVKGDPLACPGMGTMEDPFCSLGLAQQAIEEGKPTTIMLLPGQTKMSGLSLTTGDYVVAVRSAGQTVTIDGSNNNTPTIAVRSNNRVYLWRVWLNRANAQSLVDCTQSIPGQAGILYIDEAKLLSNGQAATFGVNASGCKVRIRRTLGTGLAGGIQVSGGSLRVDSSLFHTNGGAGTQFGAFSFISPTDVTISYSSFLDHPATNSASTFKCGGVKPAEGIVVRNSAIINVNPLETNTCADWVTDTGSFVMGGGSIGEIAAIRDSCFTKTGDSFGVKVGGPLDGLATWAMGDPAIDLDGTPIPQGEPTFAGHDQKPK